MVKAKAVITFAQISNALHVTLPHPFVSGNEVQMPRGNRGQYMWRSIIKKYGFRCNPAAVSISDAVLNPGAHGCLDPLCKTKYESCFALNVFLWNLIEIHSTLCILYLHWDNSGFLQCFHLL